MILTKNKEGKVKRSKKRWLLLGGLSCLLAVSFLGFQLIGDAALANYEEPSYKVISQHDGFEIREYNKKIAANVEVGGDQRTAMNRGFRILASYIFGQNVPNEKIAMTSPVVSQPGKKIAMTSPVTVDKGDGVWKITFFMPQKFSLNTLPKPKDERISITEVPEVTYAVVKFSGRWTSENFDKHKQKLLELLKENNVEMIGEPVNAYYDPPFTPPFFRRNEVMVEVAINKNENKDKKATSISSI